MKKNFYTLILALLVCVSAAADNLLLNPGFEEATSNLFGANFEDWEGTASNQSIETTDVLSGLQSAHIIAARSGSLYQELNMATATTGQQYELTIHYKLLSASGTLSLNSYWESNTAGQLQHDEDSLWVTLPAGTGWQTFTTHTTRPSDGHKLHIAVAYTKNIEVLLDDFSLTESESDAPWFTITPESGGTSSCPVGDTVLVQTYTVRQGNLTAPVTLELLGVDRTQWYVTKSRLTQDNETFSLYYTPKVAGNHRATLFVDCTQATTYSRTFSLTGSATNPTDVPVITLSKESLPNFELVEGQQSVSDTILVSATGCSEYVHITIVNDQTPGAFTINTNLMPANVQDGLCVITFHPKEFAEEYSATIYYSTEGGETRTVSVTGTVLPGEDPLEAEYDTTFHFVATSPATDLVEHFDAAEHNQPLNVAGWQNVVRGGKRGWWTLDQSNDEDFHCAKATAFVSDVVDTTTWEMWLVTPALDYRHAPTPVFSFRVRGDYLFDEMKTALELYYIDATDPAQPYFEVIAAAIPKTADEKGKWVDIVVDLSGQKTIADVFYMGFRYVGPGGVDGGPTYYIDDVIWGNAVQAMPSVIEPLHTTKLIRGGQLVIIRDGIRYNAVGAKL